MSHTGHGMTSALDGSAPMSADASGTARVPAESPLEAVMTQAGAWHLMLHGAVFPRLTAQDAFGAGSRGGTPIGAPNWAMGMAQRPIDAARLTLRAMVGANTACGDVSATLAWGLNRLVSDHGDTDARHHGGPQQAFLAEATIRRGALSVFGRGEWVEKSGEELDLAGALGDETHGVGLFGTGVDVGRVAGAAATLGGQATAYRVPEALRPLYGRAPVSLQVFLRIAAPRL